MSERKTNYKSVPGFDLLGWHDSFLLDESDSVLNHISFEQLIQLSMLDQTGSRIDMQDPDTPIGYKITRKRTNQLKFDCTDNVCLFLSCLCDRPGKIVMLCVAYAIAWDTREHWMLEPHKFTKPNMDWILEIHSRGFRAGNEFIPCDSFGLPGEEHLSKMWAAQKVDTEHGLLNALDFVTYEPQQPIE